ncbi:MAG: fumarylacetoacetate hydrolase family protein [Clostridiaceae bacterium]|nr:fumarylacetoacetate hydrolase family protein [Clostridiaceae bacterium]
MIILRFNHDGENKTGILDGGKIREITGSCYNEFDLTGTFHKLSDVKLLPPCEPKKVVAVGLNYMDHIVEFGERKIPEEPTIFIKLPHAVIGSEDSIIIPRRAERVDYEAELAVVIKKYCRRVDKEEAKDYILGATCLNDVTERCMQARDGQWTRSKNFETFCPIGPYIVTGLDYNNLDIKLLLNGEIKQHSNTSNMIWNVEELVSFISGIMPLYPGDVVTTGTTRGVGPMVPGDVVEVVIEGIGTLRNYVK